MIAIQSRSKFRVLFTRFFVACTILLSMTSARSAEPTKEQSPKEKIEKITDEEIKKLVEQLASPNKAPGNGKSGAQKWTMEYPTTYDRDSQRKVYAAKSRLEKIGKDAFPHLIEHFDDERYCLTDNHRGSVSYNLFIWQVCKEMFEHQIEPHSDHIFPGVKSKTDLFTLPLRPSYSQKFNLSDRKSAREWYEMRKNKSLVEIQLEILDWVIKEEEKDTKKYPDNEHDYLKQKYAELKKREYLPK